jgi:hypothetical protein
MGLRTLENFAQNILLDTKPKNTYRNENLNFTDKNSKCISSEGKILYIGGKKVSRWNLHNPSAEGNLTPSIDTASFPIPQEYADGVNDFNILLVIEEF